MMLSYVINNNNNDNDNNNSKTTKRRGSKAYMPKKVPSIQRIINNDILKIVNIVFSRGGQLPPPLPPPPLCTALSLQMIPSSANKRIWDLIFSEISLK